MSDVISLIPASRDDPARNLSDFVVHCRDKLQLYEGQGGFGVNQWCYTDKLGKKYAMRFAQYSPATDPYNFTPFEEPFLSFAKAYVRFHQDRHEVSSIGNKTSMLATVYDSLVELSRNLDILAVDGAVIERASDFIRERNSDGRRYHIGAQLELVINFLRDRAICPALPIWTNPYPRQRYRAQGTTAEDKAWQEERCPSLHQMLTLADIFREAEKDEDVYWSSIIVLLMFAPGRGSEPASLAIDSLIEEDGRLKVLWYAKKNAQWIKKIVPVVLESAVREAFARLMKIGEPARTAAKFAFENPGKFMRHSGCCTPVDFGEDEPMNALEFACATCLTGSVIEKLKWRPLNGLGLDDVGAWNIVGADNIIWLKAMRSSGPITYRRLAAHTLTKYQKQGWPNIPASTRAVSDSLILVLDRQFHNTFESQKFSWIIPALGALNDELGGRKYETRAGTTQRIKSIFERFGKVDEDGQTAIELTSHQLRVWLSTWAERGGMDAWQLAQWAGRARMNDNKAYDARTSGEKFEAAKAVLMLNKAPTALEAVQLNLPVTYESLGINRPGVAHATLYGYCVRDWAMAPCIKGGGKACAGCDDHKCIKGLDDKLENLEALERGLSRELARTEVEMGAETFGTNQWYSFLGYRLAKIRTLISLQKDPNQQRGAVIGVPPEFDPSPLQRARSSVVPGVSVTEQQSVQRGMTFMRLD